jgi:hypothetical protein
LRRLLVGDFSVPPAGAKDVVERISLGSRTGIGPGAINVALRGDHGLVSEGLHQHVDADIGVGELGSESMAQAVYQCTGGLFAVEARFLTVLYR